MMEHPFSLATAGDILIDAVENFRKNGDANQAAAIAFYAILSAIPLFILTLLAAGLIFGSSPAETQGRLINLIQEFHPYFSEELLSQFGHIEQKSRILGWAGIISLIWFSAMIFNALETALDIIFRSRKSRNYFLSKLLAVAMIPMGWMVGLVSVAITYIVTLAAEHPVIASSGWLAAVIVHGVLFKYIIPYIIMVAFFTFVYKVIPTGRVSLAGAFLGSALFSALMEAAKHLFTWYVANYTRYEVIYGSLQTVVILVIWVFYVALILLFCAELVSSYQRRDLILLEKAFVRKGKEKSKMDERLFRRFGRIYTEGSYVFRESDVGREMYYVLAGRVRVEKQAGQEQKVLAELEPGSYFGEMAVLIDEPRTASVRAITDSNLAVIEAETFRSLLRESTGVSLLMLQEFSRRIKNTNEKLEELTKSWSKMVAIFYFLKEWPLGADRDPAEEIAAYTGKEKAEVRDLLKALAEQGIVTMDGERIVDFSRSSVWKLPLKDEQR